MRLQLSIGLLEWVQDTSSHALQYLFSNCLWIIGVLDE